MNKSFKRLKLLLTTFLFCFPILLFNDNSYAEPKHECDIIAKSKDKTITRCSFEKEICYIIESFNEVRGESINSGVAISCFKG